jgi:hypothetical protein
MTGEPLPANAIAPQQEDRLQMHGVEIPEVLAAVGPTIERLW